MKKVFFILMSLVLALSLVTPISAVAAGVGEESMAFSSCSHSSYTSSYYYTYIYMDNDYHEAFKTERRRCNNCNDVFYTGNPQPLALQKHTCTLTYVKSVHVGSPSQHYHLYSGICTVCHERVESKTPAMCNTGNCIDPYALGELEHHLK